LEQKTALVRAVNHHPNLSPLTLHQMMRHAIDSGDSKLVEEIHAGMDNSKLDFYRRDFPISTIPQPLLCHADRLAALRNHIAHLYSPQEALWILYFSHLLAAMSAEAGALLKSHDGALEWPDSYLLYRVLLKPSTACHVPSLVDHVIKQCWDVSGFAPNALFSSPVFPLLENGMHADLRALVSSAAEVETFEWSDELRLHMINELTRCGEPVPSTLRGAPGELDEMFDPTCQNLASLPDPIAETNLLLGDDIEERVRDANPSVAGRARVVDRRHELLLTCDPTRALEVLADAVEGGREAWWRGPLARTRRLAVESGELSAVRGMRKYVGRAAVAGTISFVRCSRDEEVGSVMEHLVRSSPPTHVELARAIVDDNAPRVAEVVCERAWGMDDDKLLSKFLPALMSQGYAGAELLEHSLARITDPDRVADVFVSALRRTSDIGALLVVLRLLEARPPANASACAEVMRAVVEAGDRVAGELRWEEKLVLAERVELALAHVPAHLMSHETRALRRQLVNSLTFDT
ncbi:MAG: hypothetical protein AAFP26_12300, partial [Planctomycetota bacterium]